MDAVDGTPYYEKQLIEFASAELADMARKSIEADPELRPNQVKRVLSVQGSSLCLEVFAKDERSLKMAVQSFNQMVGVVQQAIHWFSTDDWKYKC